MRGLGESDQRPGVFLGEVFLRIRKINDIRPWETSLVIKRVEDKAGMCSVLTNVFILLVSPYSKWLGRHASLCYLNSLQIFVSLPATISKRASSFLSSASQPSPLLPTLALPFLRPSHVLPNPRSYPPFPAVMASSFYAAISSCTSPTRWIAVIRSPKDKAIP